MKSINNTSPKGEEVLARIRQVGPFTDGSLTVTSRRCGKPACRCAQEGPIHETALLTWKQGGKTQTLYVPMALREEVLAWVKEGRLLKRLVRQMSKAQRQFLISRRQITSR